MKKRTKYQTCAATAVMAFGVLGLISAPTAQAATTNALTCRNIDTGGPSRHPEGYGDGRVCDGNITGTVHDTRADGRCPYVRIHFTDGGTWDSPWAGGKGKITYFSGYYPSDYLSADLLYISC
ncbi:hypothetical protein [Streptomyces melanogenes]|uniref:hypothetical protein n=1 Tax=Streptomyces melanogenes TaxID=67326 RepID=UPI00167EB3CF|nr:hypothetical protein [Streptomyces melanogenes]GGP75336.1 hypothetical protein GCM10010278_61890 [Streptomyces melanogenes]